MLMCLDQFLFCRFFVVLKSLLACCVFISFFYHLSIEQIECVARCIWSFSLSLVRFLITVWMAENIHFRCPEVCFQVRLKPNRAEPTKVHAPTIGS